METQPDLKSLFMAAVELPPQKRAGYLDEATAVDADLRRRVEALLKAHDNPDSFLGQPAFEFAPTADVPFTELPLAEGAGTVIGPYKLLQQIGEGGMGVVFMAEQSRPVQRMVALKIIKPGMDSRQVIARLEAERQALALMDHPNIAKVLDAGSTGTGRPYFVMELVKGIPITKYCDDNHLTPRQRLGLFIPVCQAVQHAHQKGIIHRDLKPSNVLIALYDGRPVPKVIDFGVAKPTGQKLTERTMFTQFGQIVGTLEYMSPEQAELNQMDIDTRSDIYSLGVLLYELLTGTTPFESKRLREAAFDEILRIIREEDPPKPSTRLSTTEQLAAIAANRGLESKKLSGTVRGDLDWIVMKALEKDRARRYETANGMVTDIQHYLADEAVLACPPSRAYQFRKFARRHRTVLVAAALVAVALIAGTAISTWQAVRASQAESQARSNEQLARASAEQAKASEQRALTSAEQAREAADAEREARKNEQRATSRATSALTFIVSAFSHPFRAISETWTSTEEHNRWSRDEWEARERGEDVMVNSAAVLRRAAQGVEDELDGEQRSKVETLDTVARSCRAYGLSDEAVAVWEKAIEFAKTSLGPDDELRVAMIAEATPAYVAVGRASDAAALLEEAIEVTGLHGSLKEHPHQTRPETNEALQVLESKLGAIQAARGVDDPRSLIAMRDLARAYLDARHAKGIELLEKIVRARANAARPHDPEALAVTRDLAYAYLGAGRQDEGFALLKKIVDARTAELGTDHDDTLHAIQELGVAYLHEQKWDQCIPVFEGLATLQNEKLGADHHDAFATMSNLGAAYERAGWPDKARNVSEDLFARQLAKLFEKDREAMQSKYYDESKAKRQAAYAEACRFRRALLLLSQAIRIEKLKSGTIDDALLGPIEELALAYQPAALLPNRRWRTRNSENQLIWAYQLEGPPDESEAIVRECLEMREQTASDGWRNFNSRSILGAILLAKKEYDKAKPLLISGYDGMAERRTAIPAEDFLLLRAAIERVIRLFEDTSQAEQVALWKDKLSEFNRRPWKDTPAAGPAEQPGL
jgi:eukaryotic-like serine/threonine-protein kinase